MSTLARSNSLCSSRLPAALSSSVTLAGSTVTRAYVPGPLRFDSVPGLTTRTESTTWEKRTHQQAGRSLAPGNGRRLLTLANGVSTLGQTSTSGRTFNHSPSFA